MKTLGYYNGIIDETERLYVPALDRGCYFGDGVYEVIYTKNYRLFALDEHIRRFFYSMDVIGIKLKETVESVKEILISLVKMMDAGDNSVYVQATRGTGERKHAFHGDGNLWIMIKPSVMPPIYNKVKLVSTADMRHGYCNIKSLNLLPNVLAANYAESKGCFECVFVRDGIVTECSHSNIAIIKDGCVVTHPADNRILSGVARKHLIRTCESMGVKVTERRFSYGELLTSDETIITASGYLCLAAEEIDGKKIGGNAAVLLNDLLRRIGGEFIAATDI